VTRHPFGPGVDQWFSKLYQERSAGPISEAIVLWKSATETAAWKTLTRLSCRVCFPSARVRFVGPAGEERTGPTFSPALFYVGTRAEQFEKAAWIDRQAGVKLCEHCYGREVRENAREVGLV